MAEEGDVQDSVDTNGPESPVPAGSEVLTALDIPDTNVAEPSAAVESPGSSPDSKDGLRRASSKIANLRAAFERQGSGSTSPSLDVAKRRFERSPARTWDRDAEFVRLKDQHDVGIAKLKQDQEIELTRLREEIESEVVLRQALEKTNVQLEGLVEELRTTSSGQDGHWQADFERKTAELTREKAQALEEASNMQRQLFELKRDISASTRVENQVSDSTFAQQMQNLYFEAQNWVVNNFRRIKVDVPASEMCARLESIAEPKQLDVLRPVFQNWEPAMKLVAFQATVACYMMEIFHEPLLFGLPSQAEWCKNLKKAADTLPAILTPAAYNKWRSTTLDAIRQSEGIAESVESTSRNLAEMICITLSTMAEAEESESRISSLNAIIKRAVLLAHQFRIQRAQYEFALPSPGAQFLSATMEDTSADGDHPTERFIRCSAFPSVIKLGDENGANNQISTLVVKAKVVCNG